LVNDTDTVLNSSDGSGISSSSWVDSGPLGVVAATLLLSYFSLNSAENSLGVEGSRDLFSAIGVMIFRSAIIRTQLANPFRFMPLTFHGKPMVGGLPNRRLDLGIINKASRWFKEAKQNAPLLLGEFYDKMNPNNLISPYGRLL
jgi:hypothetical protein